MEHEEAEGLPNGLVPESLHDQTSHAATDAATAGSDSSRHDSVVSTDPLAFESTKSHGLGSALNEVNRRDDEENHHRKSNRTDLSNKSVAEETVGSEYTFSLGGCESPATRKHKSHRRNSGSNRKSRLTPPSDASNVPPSMPIRSVSNHNKKYDEDFNIPAISPSGRVRRLLDVSERKYRRPSLGKDSDRSSRFMRRPSLGNDPDRDSRFTRRASLDSLAGSTDSSTPVPVRRHSGSGRRNPRSRLRASLDTCPSIPSRPNPYDPNLSPESRKQRLLSLKQSFLTPTRSKTPRTSPSISGGRKRIGKTPPGGRKYSIGALPLTDSPCLEEEDSSNQSNKLQE